MKLTAQKVKKYFNLTNKALALARRHLNHKREREAKEVLDMAQRYCDDAAWFEQQGNLVSAFAAINYAHGWLDAGSRLGLFKVKDTKLFVIK